MTIKKVFRDKEGNIINIGDWDYQYRDLYADDKDKPIRDHTIFNHNPDGSPAEPPIIGYVQKKVGEVADNPLPEGATEAEEEVIEGVDGGLYHHTEYQKLREIAYPSIGDQLDALFKAGVFPPDMAAQLQAVKDKYPKVTS